MTDTKDRGVAAVSPSEPALLDRIETAVDAWGLGDLTSNDAMKFIDAELHSERWKRPAAPAVPPEPTPRTDWPDYIDVGGPDTDRGISTEELGRGRAPEPTPVGAYWWCSRCNTEVDGRNVTFEELHDGCGQRVESHAADSRAPAEVLEALKRDVLAIVRKSMTDTGFKYWSKEISKRFDAAVKEPTK